MLNRDFKEFAELLNAKGVDYLVVGGYALAAHGHPRYTDDIDFWVRPDSPNLQRLMSVLADFGFASLGLSVGGVRLPIIGLQDFKTNKRASGRLKDLADLEALDGPAPPRSD